MLVLAAGLPLAVLSVAVLGQERRALALAEKSLQLATVEEVATDVTRALDDAADTTHRAGALLTDAAGPTEDARLRLLRDTVGHSDALAMLAIYGADGALVDAIGRTGVEAPPAEARIATGDPPGWKIDPATSTFRYREPCRQGTVVRAFVVGTLRPELLSDALAAIADRTFGSAHRPLVALVDEHARVLATTGDFSPGAVLLRPALSPGSFAAPFGLTAEYRARGAARVGSLRTLPELRLAVVVERSRDRAYAALTGARRSLAAAGALVLLGAILLGGWLARRTAVPVEAELHRRAEVERDLSRFLPDEVARAIAAGRQSLALGGERRAITVLFADVVAFTSFAESAPPEQVVSFLNELFSVMSEVVFRHGGTVDKFIGDSVMALFGAPTPQPDHPRRALAAAEGLQRFVEASRGEWRTRYGHDVRIGIGVHTGEALVGNLGSARRMEYTAIGDVVNVAARLETLARPGQTLVTAACAEAAGGEFTFAALGSHALRGKQQPVEILELK